MIIQVDTNSRIPIFEQLKSQIIKKIIDNSLPEGTKLPSVRQLASDLSINLHTVSKSYKILENEGWLSINMKQGAFINVDIDRIKLHYKEPELLEAIEPLLNIYKFVNGDIEKLKELFELYSNKK